jgi:hypothetical protein
MHHRKYTEYLREELDFLKLLVDRFHKHEKVAGLELDIALLKAQDIYEHLLKMKLTPADGAESRVEADEPQSAMPEEKKTVAAPKEQPEKKEEPTPEAKAKPEPPKPGKEILAEKIRPADYHPINETLAQQKKTTVDVAGKWQTAPLENIASGIGLNDRFLYIRELFQGDGALYDAAVKQLDAAESLDHALSFIDKHFGWNKDEETVQKFFGLVYRRHRV